MYLCIVQNCLLPLYTVSALFIQENLFGWCLGEPWKLQSLRNSIPFAISQIFYVFQLLQPPPCGQCGRNLCLGLSGSTDRFLCIQNLSTKQKETKLQLFLFLKSLLYT